LGAVVSSGIAGIDHFVGNFSLARLPVSKQASNFTQRIFL
jgi:hypothetical protein